MPIPYPKTNDSPTSLTSSSLSYPPSSSSSSASSASSSIDEDEESALIQAEWEESMRQLETVLSIVIIPFFGKWWGRKWAFWAWDRYLHLGFTRPFFGFQPAY